ncbi:MAG: D-alanine--D-alanine ligase [Myxococcales bacterium]|nr:MAG: D-alanine--D-alanine ligase [Myxococcales bacterium]
MTATKRRVGVVMGGASGEREVSMRSGQAVLEALRERGWDAVPVVLGPGVDAATALRLSRVEAVFLALHGRLGEDGCVQGLCELLGIPYTGSSVLASALAMDKAKAKELFRLHNVPTPGAYVIEDTDDLADLEEMHGGFGFPVMVKPCREGSSLGLARANTMTELAAAVAEALEHDRTVLVERFAKGREVTVGLLDGRVLGCLEVAPKSGVYDFESKYTPGMTEYFVPARLTATRQRGVLNLAERAARALGCGGAVRVDLVVSDDENEVVLEVNTLPGMTATSLLPRIAAAAGYDFGHLCEAIVEGATLHNQGARRRPRPAAVPAVDLRELTAAAAANE